MPSLLTADLPGTGGLIKETPEDFFVEELPLYLPCGEGEHLYLTVEKKGLTTFELLQRLAGALGVRERDFGYAGLKDARATTRQTVSVAGVPVERGLALRLDGVTVLSASLHRNKLRLGHLAGNRFVIRLRQVAPDALENARAILGVLESSGVPNRFGRQRYGALGNSDRIGRALLRRDYPEVVRELIGDPAVIDNERWREAARCFAGGDLRRTLDLLPAHCRNERTVLRALCEGRSADEAVRLLPHKLLRLYLSAYQSRLFDRLVESRLPALGTLLPGDLAYKHANGACFPVSDPATEQRRADCFEISPSAPLFGCKVPLAKDQAGRLEEELLASEGLSLGDFHLGAGLTMEGERRPLRVPLHAPQLRSEGDDLLLGFSLPKGSYATCVADEVMKPPSL